MNSEPDILRRESLLRVSVRGLICAVLLAIGGTVWVTNYVAGLNLDASLLLIALIAFVLCFGMALSVYIAARFITLLLGKSGKGDS